MRLFWHLSLGFVRLFALFFKALFRNGLSNNELVIDSGTGGWRLLEYQFLFESLNERGDLIPVKTIYDGSEPYWRHILSVLKIYRPKQIFIDPRTFANNSKWNWLISTIITSALLKAAQVRVIAWMTDYPHRRWRFVAFLLTHDRGIVGSLMSPKAMTKGIYHSNVVGPLPIPVPNGILPRISVDIGKCKHDIGFVGALYEPRTTKLDAISDMLGKKGVSLYLKSRSLSGHRMSDADYFSALSSCKIILTTSDQVYDKESDMVVEPHLIFRYLEVLACGRVLVAPRVEGATFLKPYINYVPYENEDELLHWVVKLLNEPQLLESIARDGYKVSRELVQNQYFWRTLGVIN